MVSVGICLTHTQDYSNHGCFTKLFCKLYQSLTLVKVFYPYVTTVCDHYKGKVNFSNKWEQNQAWTSPWFYKLLHFASRLKDMSFRWYKNIYFCDIAEFSCGMKDFMKKPSNKSINPRTLNSSSVISILDNKRQRSASKKIRCMICNLLWLKGFIIKPMWWYWVHKHKINNMFKVND